MTRKIVLGIVGGALLAAGTTFAFKDWVFIQMVFRGVFGPAMAVAGLVCLTMLRD